MEDIHDRTRYIFISRIYENLKDRLRKGLLALFSCIIVFISGEMLVQLPGKHSTGNYDYKPFNWANNFGTLKALWASKTWELWVYFHMRIREKYMSRKYMNRWKSIIQENLRYMIKTIHVNTGKGKPKERILAKKMKTLSYFQVKFSTAISSIKQVFHHHQIDRLLRPRLWLVGHRILERHSEHPVNLAQSRRLPIIQTIVEVVKIAWCKNRIHKILDLGCSQRFYYESVALSLKEERFWSSSRHVPLGRLTQTFDETSFDIFAFLKNIIKLVWISREVQHFSFFISTRRNLKIVELIFNNGVTTDI